MSRLFPEKDTPVISENGGLSGRGSGLSKLPFGVDQDVNRTVIGGPHGHRVPKAPGLNFKSARPELLAQLPIEFIGTVGRCRGSERRAAPFASITKQREIADHQDRATGFHDIKIHFAGVVVENAQVADFGRHGVHIVGLVVLPDSDVNEQTAFDATDHFIDRFMTIRFGYDRHRGFEDTLNDRTHLCRLLGIERLCALRHPFRLVADPISKLART